MYLIVGLGNPESDYDKTRHNMGFHVINSLAKEFEIEINRNKFKGLFEKFIFENKNVIFVKPQTFMNLSGECVKAFVDYYKIDLENICIVYDDIDLEPGQIRVRKKGGSGGHNGMKSIIENLDSQDFARIRIGIGRPKDSSELIEHVIGFVPEDELVVLESGVDRAKEAVKEFLRNGIDVTMNKFNV